MELVVIFTHLCYFVLFSPVLHRVCDWNSLKNQWRDPQPEVVRGVTIFLHPPSTEQISRSLLKLMMLPRHFIKWFPIKQTNNLARAASDWSAWPQHWAAIGPAPTIVMTEHSGLWWSNISSSYFIYFSSQIICRGGAGFCFPSLVLVLGECCSCILYWPGHCNGINSLTHTCVLSRSVSPPSRIHSSRSGWKCTVAGSVPRISAWYTA